MNAHVAGRPAWIEFGVLKFIRTVIFGSRWLLVLFFLGLIGIQVMYGVKFIEQLWDITKHFLEFDENQMMLAALSMVDVVMIANLLKTIISGSYYSLVEKTDYVPTEKVSSGYLKVKMTMSLVGISSIHLLQAFINSAETSDRDLYIKVGIHMVFLISTIGCAIVEYLHEKSHAFHAATGGNNGGDH